MDAELLMESYQQHGVDLFGPTRLNPSWQAREGGFDMTQFTFQWGSERAGYPQGKPSVYWHPFVTQPYGRPVVKVRFSPQDCTPCPQCDQCVRSPTGQPRSLIVPHQPHFGALQEALQRIISEEGRPECRQRAGVEGSLSQVVRRCGLRRARYGGLAKTHLQHLATAAALNVVRAFEHLRGRPLAQTRTSPFARLAA